MVGLFVLCSIKYTVSLLLGSSGSCRYILTMWKKTFSFRIWWSLSALTGWLVTLPSVSVCGIGSLFLEWQWWRETKTDYPGPDGEECGLCTVCFWINRLCLCCSVSYLIGRGRYITAGWLLYNPLAPDRLPQVGCAPDVCSARLIGHKHKRHTHTHTHWLEAASRGSKADCLLSQSSQVLSE